MESIKSWLGILLVLGLVSTTSFFLGTSFQAEPQTRVSDIEWEERIGAIEEHLLELKRRTADGVQLVSKSGETALAERSSEDDSLFQISFSVPKDHKLAVEHMGKLFEALKVAGFNMDGSTKVDEKDLPPEEPEITEEKFVEDGSIRSFSRGAQCLDSFNGKSPNVTMLPCHGRLGGQEWKYTPEGNIVGWGGLCLDATDLKSGDIIHVKPCEKDNLFQQWDWKVRKMKLFTPVGKIINRGDKQLCLASFTRYHEVDRVRVEKCRELCHHYWHIYDLREDVQELVKERNLPVPVKPGAEHQKILCWVMTDPKNLHTKSLYVNDTWGPKCDLLLFMTTVHKEGLNTVALDIGAPESRQMLWRKSKAAWLHCYEKYKNDYDWFMRVDDDSYVMMDNLREYLMTMSPDDVHYIGRTLLMGGREDRKFYSGGAGNILSRAGLIKFGKAVTADPSLFADWDTFADDAEIAFTLARAGIPCEDTRDPEGRHRFFPLGVNYERDLYKEDDPTLWFFVYDPEFKGGLSCCSRRWLISHYTNKVEMYQYDDAHTLKCEAAGFDPAY